MHFTIFFLQAQEACGPLEIDNALSMVRGLEKDMQEAKASAEAGKLKPLPGETVRHGQTSSSSKAQQNELLLEEILRKLLFVFDSAGEMHPRPR